MRFKSILVALLLGGCANGLSAPGEPYDPNSGHADVNAPTAPADAGASDPVPAAPSDAAVAADPAADPVDPADPAATTSDEDDKPPSEVVIFERPGENGEGLAIPDADETTGVSDTVTVDAAFDVAALRIDVAVDHSYYQDLRMFITAPANGGRALIYDGSDYGPPVEGEPFPIAFWQVDLEGVSSMGEWKLEVYDVAAGDEGRLVEWSLQLIPRIPADAATE